MIALRFSRFGLAMLALLAAPGAAGADGAACLVERAIPATLAKTDAVENYSSVLELCSNGASRRVAIRQMRIGSTAALLLADPETLQTELQAAACWTCRDAEPSELAETRYMRAVARSAEAPGLTQRGFLQNAGLAHGTGEGVYLTGDLCPSTRPLDREFIDGVMRQGPHTPIALSISGLWLVHHFGDYRWLLERQAAGDIDIVWVNHSYHHPFRRGVPFDRNFLLTPGVDPDAEILDTERLLIANGQTPSLFFRFPGLISNAPLMEAARRHHLVSLGADAWLALRQTPRPGSIVLVHPNGNEPAGLRIFLRDVGQGSLPQPLRRLEEAPP